ncbi:MAG: tetratricopeptide repeat protein, partial [Syntrophaceae bacterium]|nr:tetratricopeptide repeat protein [Syntrophaceae bacterium]
PLERFGSQKGNLILWQLREKTLFFILSIIFSIITLFAQYNPSLKHFSLGYRLTCAPFAFMTYLEKIFWPHNLAVLYPIVDKIPVWQIWLSAFLIFLVSTAVILMVRRWPYLFVGWLWYAITILPVIGITQIGTHSIHDLYTYLPSVGIAVMLAWGIPQVLPKEGTCKKILLTAGVVVLILLSVSTWRQCGYWKNSITLLNHDLQVTKGVIALTHNNIGVSLAEEGKTDEAIYHYNEAIRLKPTYADAYNNKGAIYGELKQYQLAIENFNKAVALKPDFAKAFYNRGTAYTYIGKYQLAIENYNEAIRLKPDYADAHNNRAVAYFKKGNIELGCYEAKKACARGYCAILATAKAEGYCR